MSFEHPDLRRITKIGPWAIVICIGVLIALVNFVNRAKIRLPSHPNYYTESLGKNAPCPGSIKSQTFNSNFLPDKLNGEKPMKVTWNWYACHAPKSGDIALVRISKDLPPVPKVIRAVEGDTLAVQMNSSKSAWNLWVNGKIVPDYRNSPYYFGGKVLPMIGRNLQKRGLRLGSQDVVALSTRSPGEMDSGIFGILSVEDLVAKVEP
jgi:hypothetical protein